MRLTNKTVEAHPRSHDPGAELSQSDVTPGQLIYEAWHTGPNGEHEDGWLPWEKAPWRDRWERAAAALTKVKGEREAFDAWVEEEIGPGSAGRWLSTEAYENPRVQDHRTGWTACLRWAAVALSVPKSGPFLPMPASREASAMIDLVLAEYHFPANPKNGARAGFEAARRLLAEQRFPKSAPPKPRFEMTYCSQCGCELGPGDAGVSNCYDHTGLYPED